VASTAQSARACRRLSSPEPKRKPGQPCTQRPAAAGVAAADLTQALELYRGLGDRLGQASALDNLGRVQ
jgi:hypothetical protein